ncbi:MSF1-domain-containing protein [Pseudovirgaria hyperparasitica]|uniref:MSF1-domain-containing protein n=1 Tax=Pseudovirgaria hyperparasitica TaxID=470096 RepID=A0A6A6VVJ5_9PEZI|nr:MSF1-domain-containing protein [Pseudovirgaria hyperparasitica]KAF2753277.1 MSF1-domain-containing protein [Pseudovirgaria hyperparasitica]
MVKFYETSYSYDYSFSAVALAYFLRYPNPYSTHVVSTDVIDRSYDPASQQLTTTRLHLKKSRVPAAVLALLPRRAVGASEKGDSQSFILETSTVDIKNGWMKTESRNLEWTGVLSVIEKQMYRRPIEVTNITFSNCENAAAAHGIIGPNSREADLKTYEKTDVTTTVVLQSRVNLLKWRSNSSGTMNGDEKQGFFSRWSMGPVQRSIESIGFKRAQRSQPNAKEGMKVVLERLRQGGLVAVLDGMRRDREEANQGVFKRRYGEGDDTKATEVDE